MQVKMRKLTSSVFTKLFFSFSVQIDKWNVGWLGATYLHQRSRDVEPTCSEMESDAMFVKEELTASLIF